MSKISELKPLAVQLPDSANMLPAYKKNQNKSCFVMNRAERFSYPPHQQIAIALRRSSSHILCARCTDGSSEPWLTDSDGGRERDDWRLTDGGGGLS